MKRRILYLLLLTTLICVSCFRVDNTKNDFIPEESSVKTISDYPEPVTKTINGTDFLQSMLPEGKFGSKIVVSTIGEGPKTFNPWVSKDNTSSTIAALMFDSLLTTDLNTGKVIPNLAKEIKEFDGGKTYEITLRRGLKWSDGHTLTADDVVFTWNDIILAGYGNTSLKDSVTVNGKMPIVTKVDDYTIRFSSSETFAPMLRMLGESIAPKHVLSPVVKRGKQAFDAFWGTSDSPSKFVCSGPFILKEYVPAQRVVLKRNPKYFMVNKSGKRLPYLDEYVFLIVGDLNNEILKFEAGETDLISVRGKDAARFKEKQKSSHYEMYNLGPDTGTSFLTFNLNPRRNSAGEYYVPKEKQEWFSDINFRKAVDYAIDRDSICANILNGAGSPLFLPEPFGSVFLNEKIANGHPRDIKKAEELLKKSGFYKNGNGELFDKHGNRVEFDLLTNAGNTEREFTGVMIKDDLSELGMKVNFLPLEFNTLIGKIQNTYNWDAIILGLTGNTLEPHSGKNVWFSDGALHLFNQRNSQTDDLFEFEKELDEAFHNAVTVTDYDERKKYYDEYQQIVYDNKPIIYLYSPLRIYAVDKKLQNVYPTKLGGIIQNPAEIYVDE